MTKKKVVLDINKLGCTICCMRDSLVFFQLHLFMMQLLQEANMWYTFRNSYRAHSFPTAKHGWEKKSWFLAKNPKNRFIWFKSMIFFLFKSDLIKQTLIKSWCTKHWLLDKISLLRYCFILPRKKLEILFECCVLKTALIMNDFFVHCTVNYK